MLACLAGGRSVWRIGEQGNVIEGYNIVHFTLHAWAAELLGNAPKNTPARLPWPARGVQILSDTEILVSRRREKGLLFSFLSRSNSTICQTADCIRVWLFS